MSLKLIVNNKDNWDAMLEELDSRIDFSHKQMEQRTELEELYRLQGEVRALRSLTQLRDKVNDKLGIPKPPIPSDYYTKLGSLDVNNAGKIPISSYPSILESIASGAEGKGIGKFLSGGSPKTIAQQAAGNFIKEKNCFH